MVFVSASAEYIAKLRRIFETYALGCKDNIRGEQKSGTPELNKLIEAEIYGDNVAEGLNEFVDSFGIRLPILVTLQVVSVDHQVKQWNVLVLMFVEVFLDVEGFDGKLVSIDENAEISVGHIGVTLDALDDDFSYSLLYEVKHIVGDLLVCNHRAKL